MHLDRETFRLKDELTCLRETFLMTAYGCRLAIHTGRQRKNFPAQAFPEIQGAAYALDCTVRHWESDQESEVDFFESVCRQSVIAAMSDLRHHSGKLLPTFNNLEPRKDKFPLELSDQIENQPTVWGSWRRNDDLPKLESLRDTSISLARDSMPHLFRILELGHLSCAVVNQTDLILGEIEGKIKN